MKHHLLLLFVIFLISYQSETKSEAPKSSDAEFLANQALLDSVLQKNNASVEQIKPLIRFTEQEVAKYIIATIMDQSPSIIKSRKSGSAYSVWYIRPDYGKKFEYEVRINHPNAVWRTAGGRWRDGQYDEKITFSEQGNSLVVKQIFSNGSQNSKQYSK